MRTAVSLPPFTDATTVVTLAVDAEQAGWAPGVPADEYEAAGATWLVDSAWPEGDWVTDIRARVTAGP